MKIPEKELEACPKIEQPQACSRTKVRAWKKRKLGCYHLFELLLAYQYSVIIMPTNSINGLGEVIKEPEKVNGKNFLENQGSPIQFIA